MPKFSIILPTYNRADGRLQRALSSVRMQTYRDFECIIVNDCSTDGTVDVYNSLYWDDVSEQFAYIRHEQRQGRVIARNTGMEAAEGEWFCWLDSDDALDQMYLATFAHNIEQEPSARLWVCGAVVHGFGGEPKARTVPVWTKIRPAWMPPVDSNGRHELFTSGKVGTGMFVFHRECYEEVGPMLPWQHPDHIADGIDEWLGLEYGTTGYGSGKRGPVVRGHVGNPWGEDHAFFQKICLHYRVHLIHAALYTHYVR